MPTPYAKPLRLSLTRSPCFADAGWGSKMWTGLKPP